MGRPLIAEIVLIFRGTHQVLSAEKRLKQAGVSLKLIPVPRSLTSDCGLAIRIFPEAREKARRILSEGGLLPFSVHILRSDGGYEEVPFDAAASEPGGE